MVVAEQKILYLWGLRFKESAKKIPLRPRLLEKLALVYAGASVIFLVEAKYDFFSNLSKISLLNSIFPEHWRLFAIYMVIPLFFVLDYFASKFVAFVSSGRNTSIISKRAADTGVSAVPGNLQRGSVKEDEVSKVPVVPVPLSVDEYNILKKDKRYKDYLIRLRDSRIAKSTEHDPTDGGPTDEAILAELLAEHKR